MNADFSSVKTLLFDYGGTLDTNGRHWAHVLWDAYLYAGVPVDETTFREAYVYGERYLGSHAVIEVQDDFCLVLQKKVKLEFDYLVGQKKLTSSPKTVVEFINKIVLWCNGYVWRNLQQTWRVLDILKQRYTLGLVSNFYGNLPAVLRTYKLDGYFTTVIESAAVGIRKPDAAIYALGIDSTKSQAASTVVIGDSFRKDILPAKQLGCQAIWIKGETWKPEQNDESIPDAIISDFSELERILI